MRLEALESRDMLATIMVTTHEDNWNPSFPTAQDGKVTLREAIHAANTNQLAGDANPGSSTGPDTIVFDSLIDNRTILLDRTFGELVINDTVPLTIDASWLNKLTIHGNDPSAARNRNGIRLFRVEDPTAGQRPLVSFIGLTLTESDVSEQGGAIRSTTSILVRNCFFEFNEADSGGAIYVESINPGNAREMLRIENSTVRNNLASVGGGVMVVSGTAFDSRSDTMIITNGTVISDNVGESRAGGLHATLFDATLTITGGTLFARNRAGIIGSSADGGGLYASMDNVANLTVANSRFEFNTATNRAGGVLVEVFGGSTANVSQVTFNNNRSREGGGLFGVVRGSQFPVQRSLLAIENNTLFIENQMEPVIGGSGGGAYPQLQNKGDAQIRNALFEGNSALADGGAIFAFIESNADSEFRIEDSTIRSNISNRGGGLFVRMPNEDASLARDSRFHILRTVIEGNRAEGQGGGIFTGIGAGGKMTIEKSTISRNDAGILRPGAVAPIPDSGGGIYAFMHSEDYPGSLFGPSSLTIRDTTIDGNVAGSHGGGLAVCSKRPDTGANSVTDQSGARLGIVNSTISGNRAGRTTSANYEGTGGAIHIGIYYRNNQAIRADIRNTTITGNVAGQGGGILSPEPTTPGSRVNLSLWNTIVSGNRNHNQAANNFWGELILTETRHNLISDSSPDPNDNRFVDHISKAVFSGNVTAFGAGNQNNSGTNDPRLFPLTYLGGPTRTHAPRKTLSIADDSPAIGAGNNGLAVDPETNLVLPFDQRGTGFPRIEGTVDIGAFEVRDTISPRVQAVFIGSSTSPPLLHPDFQVPFGPDQLRTVPVGSPNQLIVHFSEPVSLLSVPPGTKPLDIMGVRQSSIAYTVTSVTPNANVVTWQFSSGGGVIQDFLKFTISDFVLDYAGNRLDGDFVNAGFLNDPNAQTTPSGNGNAGGPFQFYVTLVPGDFNRDNIVDGSDFGVWNTHKFTGIGTKTFVQGDGNGDGSVDGSDFGIWNGLKFTVWTTLGGAEESGFRETGDDPIPRAIDELVERFELFPDGILNPTLSLETWSDFALSVARVFSMYGSSYYGGGGV